MFTQMIAAHMSKNTTTGNRGVGPQDASINAADNQGFFLEKVMQRMTWMNQSM
jgi:hypothetical protein